MSENRKPQYKKAEPFTQARLDKARQNAPIHASNPIHEAVEKAVTADDIARAESSSTKMLLAMGRLGKRVYEGTVSGSVKAQRRRRNKAARAARRLRR